MDQGIIFYGAFQSRLFFSIFQAHWYYWKYFRKEKSKVYKNHFWCDNHRCQMTSFLFKCRLFSKQRIWTAPHNEQSLGQAKRMQLDFQSNYEIISLDSTHCKKIQFRATSIENGHHDWGPSERSKQGRYYTLRCLGWSIAE